MTQGHRSAWHPSLRATWAVFTKELLEALREPHVLVFSVAFPVLLYPLLLWGTVELLQLQDALAERNPPRVAVEGPRALIDAVLAPPVVQVPTPDGVAGANRALLDDELDAVVSAQRDGGTVQVTVRSRSTRPRSASAGALVAQRAQGLQVAREAELEALLGLPEDALSPWKIRIDDVAPGDQRQARLVSLIVPVFLLAVIGLSVAYPAVEVVVGERERGTLETTLSATAGRGAVMAGKLLCVWALALIATASNAGATLLTIGHLSASMGVRLPGMSLSFGTIALVAATLAVGAALAAGLAVLAAMPARSFKEGQNMVTVAILAVTAPSVLAAMPLVELGWGTLWVPFVNTVLVARDAIQGEVDTAPALWALVWNTVLAGGTVALGARVAASEGFLFRGDLPRWLAWMGRLRGRG